MNLGLKNIEWNNNSRICAKQIHYLSNIHSNNIFSANSIAWQIKFSSILFFMPTSLSKQEVIMCKDYTAILPSESFSVKIFDT